MLGTWRPLPHSPRLTASPPQKAGKPRSLRVAELGMALPHAPNVADLGIDFADEFAHLGQMTEFAGRVGEALGLVINRSSDVSMSAAQYQAPRASPLNRPPPGSGWQNAASRAWLLAGRSAVPNGPAYPAASKVWLSQLPASLGCRRGGGICRVERLGNSKSRFARVERIH